MVAIELVVPVLLLLFFLVIGAPVAYAMIISGTLGLILALGVGGASGIIANTFHAQVTNYILTTIPTFILMAEILKQADVTTDLYSVLHTWIKHVRGGLAMATVFANGIMAALIGSSTATVATLSSIAVPEMSEYGYNDTISLGTVAAAGTFAIMFPPSLGLILVGIITQTNIGELFIAGIVPGILTAVGYIGIIVAWSFYDRDAVGETLDQSSWNDRAKSLTKVWPALLLIIVVLWGIYAGVMTPTEAGGVGATGALVILLARGGSREDVVQACRDAAELTGVIFMILIGAFIFSSYIGITGFTDVVLEFLVALPGGDITIIILILAFYVFLGAFMDQLAILILTLPITYPVIVDSLGYSAIWFGILIVKTIEIGLITPPLGLNVFVATSTVDMNAREGFIGSAAFLTADLVVIAMLLLFPGIVSIL